MPWRPRRAQQPQVAAGQFAPGHFVRRYKKGADTVRYSADVCPMTGRYNMPRTQCIFFNNTKLMFVDELSHLGHNILTYNLNDKQDIIRVAKDMNWKANSILCKFSALDCAIKCYLIKSYCLALYGSALWSLGSPSIQKFEISLNKILRTLHVTY